MIDSNKLGIKLPEITVNVKSSATKKVRTETINGQKCLVIDIDDSIEINGLNILP